MSDQQSGSPDASESTKSNSQSNSREDDMSQETAATEPVAEGTETEVESQEVSPQVQSPATAPAPAGTRQKKSAPTAKAIEQFANRILPNLVRGRNLLGTVRGGSAEGNVQEATAFRNFIQEAMSRLEEAAKRGTDSGKIARINKTAEDLGERYWKRFWDFVHNEIHVFQKFMGWLKNTAPRTHAKRLRELENAQLMLTDALAEEKRDFDVIASATSGLRTLREEVNTDATREANKAFEVRSVRASATDALAAVRALIGGLDLGIETEEEEDGESEEGENA